MDQKSPCASHISIFDRACSSTPKIAPIPCNLICSGPKQRLQGRELQIQVTQDTALSLCCFVVISRPVSVLAMHLIELDQESLLHLFSYLDKDSRRSLSLTCVRLRQVFLDPQLWTLLHFGSPCELRRDNFVLGSSLRYLAVCWHSSRVKVCNIEHWMKTTFQKDLCSKHESLVSDFLERVCNMCPNLISLTLSGCGHIMDNNVIKVLHSCRRLRSLSLENCARMTDSVLKAAVDHGHYLTEVKVDFCRNVTQAGLQELRKRRPEVHLSALHSADMIPDCKPEEKTHIRRALQKFLIS